MQHPKHLHVVVTDLGPGIQAVYQELPDKTQALVINDRVLEGDEGVRGGAHALLVEFLKSAA